MPHIDSTQHREIQNGQRPGGLRRLLTQRSAALLCCVVLGLSLLPLLVISRYNHPLADDFNFGVNAFHAFQDTGSLFEVLSAAARRTAEIYESWQGTFSAVFLMSAQPAVFGEQFYFLTVFIMLGSLLFSTCFLLVTLCRKLLSMSRSATALVACALCFLCVQFPPSAFEGFFWFNGAVFYTFFHALLLVQLALILRLLHAPQTKSTWPCLTGIGLLSLCIGGGNYTTALLAAVLLFGAAVFSFVRRDSLRKKLGLLLCALLLLVGFALSMAAPGNAVRQAYFPDTPSAPVAVLWALITAGYDVLNWTLRLPVLPCLLLLVPMFCRSARKLSFSFRLPLLVPLASLCLLGVELTPPIYAMGIRNQGPVRLTNLVFFTYCLLLAVNLFYFCGWYVRHRERAASSQTAETQQGKGMFRRLHLWQSTPLRRALPLCILATLFLGGCLLVQKPAASLSALRSLRSGEAQTYHRQVEERLVLLNDPAVTAVELPALTAFPALLAPKTATAVTTDPEDTTNKRVAAYYRKESVRVVSPSAGKAG